MGPISLDQEVTEVVTGTPVPNALPSTFPHPIAFNLIPHVDQFREDGYTKEELKMCNESRKILSLPNLLVSCTCVRVPVYQHIRFPSTQNSKTESTYLMPNKHSLPSKAWILWKTLTKTYYPMPIYTSEKEIVKWAG